MRPVVPASLTVQPLAGAAPGGGRLIIADPPYAMDRLTLGARIAGTVLPAGPDGQVRIGTSFGEIAGEAAMPLPEGARLALIVEALVPRLVLKLAAMRAPGKGPEVPPSGGGAAPEPVTGGAATQAERAGPAVATAGGALSVGSKLEARTLEPVVWREGGVATGGGAKAGVEAVLPAGSRFVVRVTGFAAESGEARSVPAPGGASLAPGTIVRGVVAEARVSGQPVLLSAAGPLLLDTPVPLPAGRTMIVELLALLAADKPAPNGAARGDAGSDERFLPALEEALRVLAADPGPAGDVAGKVLPAPRNDLAANLLLFLAGLRAGDLRVWLGEPPLNSLRRSRPDVLSRLEDGFGAIARRADDRGPGEWRVATIPFAGEGELQSVRLLIRRRSGGDEPGQAARGNEARFVVEVGLSRIGRLQLDGLVGSRGEGGKRLDLIVRTERPLPAQIRRDIREVFREAGALTGLRGEIGFRAQPGAFVEWREPAPLHSRSDMIV